MAETATTLPSDPYVGPRQFDREDRESFFGREREVSTLLNLLIAERIVLLYSPSGAGKTSLLQAGLIPRLEAKRYFKVLPIVRVNLPPPRLADDPASDHAPNRYILSSLLSLEAGLPLADRLSDLTGFDLDTYLARQFPLPAHDRTEQVLIFDQFEELLTVDPLDHDARVIFLSAVGNVLENRQRRAVFAMREDYLAGLDPYARLIPTRFHTRFRLDLLKVDPATEAIQGPARRKDVGVDFTNDAASKLVDDLRQVQVEQSGDKVTPRLGDYVEPILLQIACVRLWKRLEPTAGTQIVEGDIESVGDVDQALAGYYADRVKDIADESRVPERAIREWVGERLIIKPGIRGQVRGGFDTSEGLANTAIEKLVKAHLVRSDQRRETTLYELAHDRFIRPIQNDNEKWFQDNLSPLQRQAGQWDRDRRPDRLLVQGADLKVMEAWAHEHQEEIGPTEREFLEACQRVEGAERDREANERKDAVLAQQRKANLLLRWLSLIPIAIAIVAVLLFFRASNEATEADAARSTAVAASTHAAAEASNAQDQKATADTARATAVAESTRAAAEASNAQEQKATAIRAGGTAVAESARAAGLVRIAHSRLLAVQSLTHIDDQPDLALLLSLEAYRFDPAVEIQSSLLTALADSPPLIVLLRGHGDGVTSVAFSRDGKVLASGSSDKTIRLWDVASHQPLGAPLSGHTSAVTSVAFSPDGKTLASASNVNPIISPRNDNTIILWDVTSHQPLGAPLSGHTKAVTSVAFSPDGKTLASASFDQTIILWDVATHQPLGTPLSGHTKAVTSVAFSPDGKVLASGSADKTIRLWDVASHQSIGAPLTGHTSSVYGVAFAPDGKVLASGSDDRTIRLWDVASHQSIGAPLTGHTDAIYGVAFSRDGKVLASGSNDRTIRLWDVASRQSIGAPLTGHTRSVYSVAFDPDGAVLASGSGDKMIRLWDVASHQSLELPLTGNTNDATNSASILNGRTIARLTDTLHLVAFSPDGNTLATANRLKTIQLWNVSTHQTIGPPLAGHEQALQSLIFSPDGKTIVSASFDETIRRWDAASRQPIGDPLDNRTRANAGTTLALSPDGNTLALAGRDTLAFTIRLWDLKTQPSPSDLGSAGDDVVLSLAFSPDGKTFAAGGRNGMIRLWNRDTHSSPGASLSGHTDSVVSVAFSPNGNTLASASLDKTIRLWDVASGQPIGLPLTGHSDAVLTVAFSPDGHVLASGSADKTIRLWDDASGKPIAALAGHTDAVLSVAFSRDGKSLASASADQTIRLWDLDLEHQVAQACQVANRNLTPEEWKQYLSDEPYHKTCPDFP